MNAIRKARQGAWHLGENAASVLKAGTLAVLELLSENVHALINTHTHITSICVLRVYIYA